MLRRMLRVFFPALLLVASLCTSIGVDYAEARGRSVSVRGYYRKDGTYVRPHYRSAPDGNFRNNWSTKGNVNPYTGKAGTRVSPPSSYGRDVHVDGYVRQDGSYVPPHYRSAPDGDASNNWSSAGNVNPHTGDVGTREFIRDVQLALTRAGESPGPADGVLGPRTAGAFASYMTREGTTDQPVEATLERLSRYVSRLAVILPAPPVAAESAPPAASEPAIEPERPTFGVGSTAIAVMTAQGHPDRSKNDTWWYGQSQVFFDQGRVVSWRESNVMLHAR